MRKCKLFYSYSHKDEEYREKLEQHLSILKRQNLISEWHDRKIIAGKEWDNEIDSNLKSADIILLLISSDFLASNYCYDTEVTIAIEKHNKGKGIVIPVIIRHVEWEESPFGKLQALPTDAKPVSAWVDSDEAYKNIVQGIRVAIDNLQEKDKKQLQGIPNQEIIRKFKSRPKKYNKQKVIAEIIIDERNFPIETGASEHLRLQLGDAIYRKFRLKDDSSKIMTDRLYAQGEIADLLEDLPKGIYKATIELLFSTWNESYRDYDGSIEFTRQSILAYKLIGIECEDSSIQSKK